MITGLSDGSDFAVSGFGADLSKNGLSNTLAKALPLLEAPSDRFPKDYDGIVSTFYEDCIAGKTEAEAVVGSRAKLLSIIATLRPHADDAVLADVGALLADQYLALGAKSPVLCYRYASGIGAKTNITEDLPESLINRENEINLRVVKTAVKRQSCWPGPGIGSPVSTSRAGVVMWCCGC